jgi:hypothetical protein
LVIRIFDRLRESYEVNVPFRGLSHRAEFDGFRERETLLRRACTNCEVAALQMQVRNARCVLAEKEDWVTSAITVVASVETKINLFGIGFAKKTHDLLFRFDVRLGVRVKDYPQSVISRLFRDSVRVPNEGRPFGGGECR